MPECNYGCSAPRRDAIDFLWHPLTSIRRFPTIGWLGRARAG